jgi:hypothetical protein
MEGFLQSLEGPEAEKLREEFYQILGEIDAGADLPPPVNPQPVIIRHVKWEHLMERVAPCARTSQFDKLPELPRGTLIFVPEDEDYEAERDEFSKEV